MTDGTFFTNAHKASFAGHLHRLLFFFICFSFLLFFFVVFLRSPNWLSIRTRVPTAVRMATQTVGVDRRPESDIMHAHNWRPYSKRLANHRRKLITQQLGLQSILS